MAGITRRAFMGGGTATAVLCATPPVANPDNGFNRNEPIAFLEAGTYLVICNVRPHLLDGMWATVKVLK
ncbi:MAG TPA: twin-arginine translocation signal domain-containing protein [Vicinamibacterales bacterium]|nr:twin-arginine translocation signal domain-containing protein [Vicinamibacterales bacterium]